jgi:hypothetical protein
LLSWGHLAWLPLELLPHILPANRPDMRWRPTAPAKSDLPNLTCQV